MPVKKKKAAPAPKIDPRISLPDLSGYDLTDGQSMRDAAVYLRGLASTYDETAQKVAQEATTAANLAYQKKQEKDAA